MDIKKYQFWEKLKNLSFVEEIWIFGSRARCDNQERSDIDLAIICPNATDDDWIKVINIIEEADTLLKIDCLRFDKNQINSSLYKNILNDKKVIYVKK